MRSKGFDLMAHCIQELASATIACINPVIAATVTTFQTMLNTTPVRDDLYIVDGADKVRRLSAVLPLSGAMVGAVLVNVDDATACGIHDRLLGTTASCVDDSVKDALGEVANMIAGSAKSQFGIAGIILGTPSVVYGADYEIYVTGQCGPPIGVAFKTELGAIQVELSLKKIPRITMPAGQRK